MGRQAIDIGVGTLDAVTAGDGPVTVVFENGLATPLEEWDVVVPPIAERARTLRYDHRYAPPNGNTPARTVSDVLDDLEKLLAALALRPPYIFVGHSWGGVIARPFANRHPSDMAGLVFVDATHEAIDTRALALLPAVYSLMIVLCRANFVRRGLVRQLCPLLRRLPIERASSSGCRIRLAGRLDFGLRAPKVQQFRRRSLHGSSNERA